MKSRSLARRYASALMELAEEQSLVDEVSRDLTLVVDTLATSEDFQGAFYGQVKPHAKQEIIREIFASSVTDLTLNFLQFLIQKRREDQLETIAEVFKDLTYQRKNLVDVQVTAATDLTEDEIKTLKVKLQHMTGKNVELQVKVDPSLLAGIRVQVGDLVLDGSVANRLQALTKHLQSTSV